MRQRPTIKQSLHHHAQRASDVRAKFFVRPPQWQRMSVYIVTGVLVLTGLLWLYAHFLLRSIIDPEVPHPLEAWALRIHGISAYACLIILGSMLPVHVKLAWQARRHLYSGIALLTFCAGLAISALGLYYAPEIAHAGLSYFHWLLGLLSIPLFIWHILRRKMRF